MHGDALQCRRIRTEEREGMQEKELKDAELPLSEKAIVKLAELYGTSVSEIKKLLASK